MKALRRLFHLKSLNAALATIIMALAWIVFIPAQIGGQTTYVIVNGNSMEPMLHKGDLVFLRQQPDYSIGEIVTYQHPNIGPVIHRIVERNLERYILQGDNNTWLDPYQPTGTELTGKYWFALPGAGKILLLVRKPWILALISGASTLVIGMSMVQLPDPQSSITKLKKKPQAWRKLGLHLANWKEAYWITVYTLAAGGIILGLFAFTRPVLRQSVDEMLYQQTGYFNYTGDVSANIYDHQQMKTGDPIFPALGCKVHFSFHYGLHTPKPFIGGGSYVINAEIWDTTGWRRTIPLAAETAFEGSQFQSEQILDVCQAQALIDNLQTTTGTRHPPYFLSLAPRVNISGQIAGQQLTEAFTPTLQFIIEPQQVYLSARGDQNQDPFKPGQAGVLSSEKMVSNSLNLLRLALPVSVARILSIAGVLLAAAAAGLAMVTFKDAEVNDERLWARLQIGEYMLETRNSPIGHQDRVVDLAGFDELIQLAEKFGGMVFFHEQPPYVDYFIRDDGLVYRFRQIERQYKMADEGTGFQQELLRALENDEFVLRFQPSASLSTGQLTQVEAFLRWEHPQRGLLMPMTFLPEAEANDLIGWIDTWVLRTGCAQLRLWRDAGFPPFALAINISSSQLRQPELASLVEEALLENGLSADALQIDISDDQFSMDMDILQNLKALRKMGVGITISSRRINLLEDTPEIASQVKIDYSVIQQSMTDQVQDSPRQWIAQAHARKVNVIAMGVETQEQLGFFRLNACDEVQGFFVRPPLSAHELSQELEAGHILLDLTADSGEAES